MKYENPVLHSDFSDPDVIRVGDDFFMVSSSFNFVPGVPVLHSKNLVEWELINYVVRELPFEGFDKVRHGNGAWAPSIRYRNGKFYCLIPFPDEGIYVTETDNIYGEWSPLRPLFPMPGAIDPCPIWADGRCYVVFAFAKSRAGFNSKLAVFEADEDLIGANDNYRIIFDGHDIAPVIEGPKLYRRGGYYYVLAPAGSVKSGWQVALRSHTIYGPYESKIILMQGDTEVNGPHQGALIDLDDNGEKWAFMHFQDAGAYGRVVHLQPAIWANDWVLCGNVTDTNLPGSPVSGGEYPVDIRTGYALPVSDDFKSASLGMQWQTPANIGEGVYELKHGLRLKCLDTDGKKFVDMPNVITQKIPHFNFTATVKCKLHLLNDGDEAGFGILGTQYAYLCVVRRDGANYLEIREGAAGGGADETLAKSQPYDDEYVKFKVTVKYEDKNKLTYKFASGGSSFTHKFYASAGVWTGARLALFARSTGLSKGYGTFNYIKVVNQDK